MRERAQPGPLRRAFRALGTCARCSTCQKSERSAKDTRAQREPVQSRKGLPTEGNNQHSDSAAATRQELGKNASRPTSRQRDLQAPYGPNNGSKMSSRRSSLAATEGLTTRDTCGSVDPGMFITHQKVHLSERYLRERKLGAGAYGEVILCRDKQTGSERAIKILRRKDISTDPGEALLDEVEVVKQLDHPNIMKLYEVFVDKKNFYIVMEVYKGGELFDEIISKQKFTEADAARIIKQVLSGVTYLHRHHIVHRDLKPENLLLESKAKDALIKIVDFGLSAYFDPNKKLQERLGTAYYIAPEVLRQKYDEQCDVWSIGVILYILLCGMASKCRLISGHGSSILRELGIIEYLAGYPPFGGNTDREILQRVERGKFHFDPADWGNISNEAKDLIVKMLTVDAAKRISAEDALSHPWIQQVARKEKKDVKEPLLVKALGNMRRFQASQKLAQAALLFMGSKLTTLEETKELTKIFRSLDMNGDGQLDRKELIRGYQMLQKLKGEEVGDASPEQIEAEVDKILDTADFDRNGFIEYSEFVTVAMDKKILLSKDRLKAAFNLFDMDGSGTIASDELRKILIDVDDAQWEAIIREVDSNNDGEVDFDEFVAMMHKLCLDKVSDGSSSVIYPGTSG